MGNLGELGAGIPKGARKLLIRQKRSVMKDPPGHAHISSRPTRRNAPREACRELVAMVPV